MGRRKKDTQFQVNVKYSSSGVAQGILNLATDYFKNQENMKAFQEGKAAKGGK